MKVRPYHLVIGFGVFWALFSIGSGLGPLVLQWFDDSPVQREVFTNIPGAWKLVFYTVLPVLFVYGSVMFANRVRNWERGAPDRRGTTPQHGGPPTPRRCPGASATSGRARTCRRCCAIPRRARCTR